MQPPQIGYWPVDTLFPNVPGPADFQDHFLYPERQSGEIVGTFYRQFVDLVEGVNGDNAAYGIGLTAPDVSEPFLATYNLTFGVPKNVQGSEANTWLNQHIMAQINLPGTP